MKKILLLLSFVIIFLSACNKDPHTYAVVETEYGNIKLALYNETPKHRDNFIKLANEGFYDDLLFHRVMNGFMIQGGDPDSKNAPPGVPLGQGGPGYTIDNEINSTHIHMKGALAAARTGDAGNPERKSSGSQFYIVHGQKLTEASIASMEKQKGIQYSEEQKKIFMEQGGTPFLDNLIVGAGLLSLELRYSLGSSSTSLFDVGGLIASLNILVATGVSPLLALK